MFSYLVFPTAHRQREKLMEETLLLRSSNSHMTSKHAVQSCTVSDEGQKKKKDKDYRELQLHIYSFFFFF